MFNVKNKPEWDRKDYKVQDLINTLAAGQLLYWLEVQRRPDGWDNSKKIKYIINKMNGLPSGANIVACDMERLIQWNEEHNNQNDVQDLEESREDLMGYRRKDPMFKGLSDTALKNKKSIFGLVDGMHRLTTLYEFHNNKFRLPKGTKLDLGYGSPLILTKNSFFKELPPVYQREFELSECAVMFVRAARCEQIKDMIIGINSAQPWTSAEKRKLIPYSVPSGFVYNIEKEYLDRVKELCSTRVYSAGKLMTAASRILSWFAHGVDKRTNDNDLDSLHNSHLSTNTGSRIIKDSDYENVETLFEDMFKILNHEEGPYRLKSNVYSVDSFYTLALAFKALKDPETNPETEYPLAVCDYSKWGKLVRTCDEYLEETIVPKRKDHKNLSEAAYREIVKQDSYENWHVWADERDVSRRYNAISEYIKENLDSLLEQGTLKIVRRNGACFSNPQKAEMRRRQDKLDPITNEPLRSDAEAHHKVPVAKNGPTTINNGVLINRDTHVVITNNTDFKDLPWDDIVEENTKKDICNLIANNKATLEAAA
jgi:hypothetical protein